jgi:DNA-binding NtrC family response regulator
MDLNTTSFNLKKYLNDHERAIIMGEFILCNQNKYKTAKRLGINRTTLVGKLKKYGVALKPPLNLKKKASDHVNVL